MSDDLFDSSLDLGLRKATPKEAEANERALRRMKKLFPRLPKSEVGNFLISCTAFPFNSLADAVEQAADLSRRAHKSVERAYHETTKEMNREMRSFRRRYPEFCNGKP